MTKILHIITRLDKGGSADLVLQTCAHLARKGYKIILVSGKTTEPPFDIHDFAKKNGFHVQFSNFLVRNIHPLKDLSALFQLVQFLRKESPEILHTHTSKAGFLGRLAGKIVGIPKIYHSPHGHIFYGYYSRLITGIFILMEKFAALFTTKILNLTETGRQDHIKKKIAPPEKFIVSSCGVDLEKFQTEPQIWFPKDKITLLWIGRFVPVKNPAMVVTVAKLLPSDRYQFIMVGDGELFSEIQKLSQDAAIEIQFPGYCENVAPYVKQSDFLIITSLNEGFGRVIVEAMAAGLPVIATHVGGIPEIIHSNRNGFLVAPTDAASMANCIVQLSRDRKKYIEISRINSLEAKKYSMENYVKNLLQIYEKTPF
ncbi:MAG: glycosyltransferase family 4 protein [Candidatus Marinimicrobia bacterium]|nr:glycosyltransferase family 4 protein [Candidatus Neomarinimicrobiota bacterium]